MTPFNFTFVGPVMVLNNKSVFLINANGKQDSYLCKYDG